MHPGAVCPFLTIRHCNMYGSEFLSPVVSCRFPNAITNCCVGLLVSDILTCLDSLPCRANKFATARYTGDVTGETCLMGFGHYSSQSVSRRPYFIASEILRFHNKYNIGLYTTITSEENQRLLCYFVSNTISRHRKLQ